MAEPAWPGGCGPPGCVEAELSAALPTPFHAGSGGAGSAGAGRAEAMKLESRQ